MEVRSLNDVTLPRELERRSRMPASVEVALLIPLGDPAGMFGPFCECCAQLAAEINKAGGLPGRRVLLVPVDAAGPLPRVAQEVEALVSHGAVDAVVGWQTPLSVRRSLPSWHAGFPTSTRPSTRVGRGHRGVFLTGEVPDRQVGPAIRWMADACGSRRWCIVVNDYIRPRSSGAQARRYVRDCAGMVDDEVSPWG